MEVQIKLKIKEIIINTFIYTYCGKIDYSAFKIAFAKDLFDLFSNSLSKIKSLKFSFCSIQDIPTLQPFSEDRNVFDRIALAL